MNKPEVITIGESMLVFNPILNTSFTDSHLFMKQIAGAESNYAIGLARLGYNVGWISRLSDDSFGYYVRNLIRGNGVDTSQVQFDSKNSTGLLIKERMVEDRINVHYYRTNSAASKMEASLLNEEYFSEAKYLFITGITPILSESCKKVLFKAIKIAKSKEVKVIFDPNIRYKLMPGKEAYKALIREIIIQSDIFLPGLNEGKFLCGEEGPEKIAENFLYLNPKLRVIVKLGGDGCFYADTEVGYYVPGCKVNEVIDPIGAGDAFAAGLTSGLLDGQSMEESLKLANLIASIIIQTSGDVEGFPYKYQLASYQPNGENRNQDVVHR